MPQFDRCERCRGSRSDRTHCRRRAMSGGDTHRAGTTMSVCSLAHALAARRDRQPEAVVAERQIDGQRRSRASVADATALRRRSSLPCSQRRSPGATGRCVARDGEPHVDGARGRRSVTRTTRTGGISSCAASSSRSLERRSRAASSDRRIDTERGEQRAAGVVARPTCAFPVWSKYSGRIPTCSASRCSARRSRCVARSWQRVGARTSAPSGGSVSSDRSARSRETATRRRRRVRTRREPLPPHSRVVASRAGIHTRPPVGTPTR